MSYLININNVTKFNPNATLAAEGLKSSAQITMQMKLVPGKQTRLCNRRLVIEYKIQNSLYQSLSDKKSPFITSTACFQATQSNIFHIKSANSLRRNQTDQAALESSSWNLEKDE